jgi:hypothetical protein
MEGQVPVVPELKVAITMILISVLILCGICAKYVKTKRIGKNSFSSPDLFQSMQ